MTDHNYISIMKILKTAKDDPRRTSNERRLFQDLHAAFKNLILNKGTLEYLNACLEEENRELKRKRELV